MSTTILLVEDNELNMELLLAVLEEFDGQIETVTAFDGVIGWECFRQLHPDMVLLDMQLPGIDGFTLARRFREYDDKVVIIGLTAYAMVGDKERVLEAGCDYYLSKPLDVAELTALISEVIETEDCS